MPSSSQGTSSSIDWKQIDANQLVNELRRSADSNGTTPVNQQSTQALYQILNDKEGQNFIKGRIQQLQQQGQSSQSGGAGNR